MSTILSKLKPSFKGWVCIIVVLFFSPFIGVFINYSTSLYFGDLYTLGISDRKDFFTVWIALFGAIGIAFNIYQNQKRTKNQDRQLENQNKQLQNQEEQLEKQQAQIDLQSKLQRDSRFSKGIELLGNDNESARTGAAYSLCFLAKDFPDEFSKSVFDILCSHIRTLTTSEEYLKKHPTVSNEVQTILNLLFKTRDGSNSIFSAYTADLGGTNLEGANLENASLRYAHLQEANLKSANLKNANLKETFLFAAHLEDTLLSKANMEGAYLEAVHMEKAILRDVNLKEAFISSDMEGFLKQSGAKLANVKWSLCKKDFSKTLI